MRAMVLAAVAAGAVGSGCCSHGAAAATAGKASAPVPGTAAGGMGAPAGASGAKNVVPGEYLFTLAAGADAKVLEAALAELSPKGTQNLGANMFLVTFADDPGLAKLEALRAKDPRIQAVQPNYVYRALPR